MNGNYWQYPAELLYDTDHHWVALDSGKALVGMTPYGFELTGDILYLSLPTIGSHVKKNEACGSLEAGKWVGRIYSPLSGTVTRINCELAKRPEHLSREPFGSWLMEIELQNLAEINELLSSAAIADFLAEEWKKDA